MLSLVLAWAMVLVASRSAAGDGEEEANAGYDRHKKRDYIEAMRWYRKAADKGNAWAMTNIGFLYQHGQGVKRDYIEAMRWYRKAADKGFAGAVRMIGSFYQHGQGVKQDYIEAMRWYRKTADKGDAKAMYNVGLLYHHGQGVKKDYIEAMRWWRRAADKGNAKAMFNVGFLYQHGQGVEQDYIEAMRWWRHALLDFHERTCVDLVVFRPSLDYVDLPVLLVLVQLSKLLPDMDLQQLELLCVCDELRGRITSVSRRFDVAIRLLDELGLGRGRVFGGLLLNPPKCAVDSSRAEVVVQVGL